MGSAIPGKGYWVSTVRGRDVLERDEEGQRFTDTNSCRAGETKAEETEREMKEYINENKSQV